MLLRDVVAADPDPASVEADVGDAGPPMAR
jgi:hypothetical protein